MRNLLFIILLFVLVGCSNGNHKCPICGYYKKRTFGGDTVSIWNSGHSSNYKYGPYKYTYYDGRPGSDTVYDNFEQYMWDEVFPDSIIVKFTQDGKFLGYETAYREGVIYDKDSNAISPAYVIGFVVWDKVVYDLKGRFVRFDESPFPHYKDPNYKFHP